jgi:glutathione S-transferase
MKLHGHPLSSCTRKALIVAGEKGAAAAVELVPIDVLGGEHKQPAHLARHPYGVIPVLDDNGFVVLESRAIIRYLDAVLPGASLTPADPRARARMDQWLSVDQSYIAPRISTLVGQRVIRPHLGLPTDAELAATTERELGQALGPIDRALADAPYLAGEAFSLADVSLMPYLAGAYLVGADGVLADLRHLQRWWGEMSARASWTRIAGATVAATAAAN